MNKEITDLQEESDKHYTYIENFVNDYTKDDEEKIEFFKHLGLYLEAELELEEICNE